MPAPFCHWRNADGTKKSLKQDYVPAFAFVNDSSTRQNLAELRMCLDYQRSIYDLLVPRGLFERQHKLVVYQVIGAIYEGILFEYLLEFTRGTDDVAKVLVKQKFSSNSFGLGSMIDLLYKGKVIKKPLYEYLDDVKELRNTIHPKSFNSPRTTYGKNRLLELSMKQIISNLDATINQISTSVSSMRNKKYPF